MAQLRRYNRTVLVGFSGSSKNDRPRLVERLVSRSRNLGYRETPMVSLSLINRLLSIFSLEERKLEYRRGGTKGTNVVSRLISQRGKVSIVDTVVGVRPHFQRKENYEDLGPFVRRTVSPIEQHSRKTERPEFVSLGLDSRVYGRIVAPAAARSPHASQISSSCPELPEGPR